MTDVPADKPPRRPRYRGRNPRHFQEKYKERQPDRYADDVAKILASGKTPAGSHRPIMVDEILKVLAPQPGQTGIDCTLGYGGHAQELLRAVQPKGTLIAIDTDPIELPKAESRLRDHGFPPESLIVKRMNFAGIARLIESVAPEGVNFVLCDLGVSSMQIDDPVRGFTFKANGPLDMRMNPARGHTAAELLQKLDEQELARLLKNNADEPLASTLARAILAAQKIEPIQTTAALAFVIRNAITQSALHADIAFEDSVRRVFQALRIAVNEEFEAIDAFLAQLPYCLKPGGRAAILSFHSGEDRRVKKAFKKGIADGLYSSISQELMRPSPDEQRANPRSKSAKLRWAIRASDGSSE